MKEMLSPYFSVNARVIFLMGVITLAAHIFLFLHKQQLEGKLASMIALCRMRVTI